MGFRRNRAMRRLFLAVGLLSLAFAGQILTGCESSPEDPPVDPDAQIVILEPRGGETYQVGQTVPIRWKTQGRGDLEINSVSLELSPDNGAEWILILNRSIGIEDTAWGEYPWTVPSQVAKLGRTYDLAGNTGLRIRIRQYGSGDPDKTAVLRKSFSVAAP